VLDEERVEGDPVRGIDARRQRAFGLLGGPGPDHAEPVGDAVHVGVDGDGGDPVAEDEHAVRRLRPDPRQRDERVVRPRHGPAEPVEDRGRGRPDRPGLGMVEPRPPDQRLDPVGRRGGERRRVRVPREQPRARDVGRLVPGALGQDRADQHLERVLRVVAQVRAPPVARVVERREAVEDRLPVERGRRGTRAHAGGSGRRTVSVPGSLRSGSSAPAPSRRISSPTR
jgi:hypothetical protein